MKTTKIIYLYIFDTLSDWEIGYITSGINNQTLLVDPERYTLKTFSIDGKAIKTMGGLLITPDLHIDEVKLAHAELLILPGGLSWDKGANQQATLLAKKFHDNQIKIAAICGGTLGLANAGILNALKHTSNSKDYLSTSQYTGGQYYVESLSVNDGGIITAPGTATLEFTREIFSDLNIYKPEVLEAWYSLFKTSSPHAYMALMKALTA